MTSSVMPGLMIAGGMSGNSAGLNNPGQLETTYENLLSGAADIVSGSGSKVLIMTSAAIGSAGVIQIGKTETAGEVAANLQVLKNIALFCTANNITVEVDAVLTYDATYGTGPGRINALVDQWATVAAIAALPITAVEDVQEIGLCQPASEFASYATIEANAVATLIKDYSSSSYKMTAQNVAVGDMEGGGPSDMAAISGWWNAYNAAAAAAGVSSFSYTTADTGWFAPWIGALSLPSWQGYLEALSALAVANKMAMDVVVQGDGTATSANQDIQQAEQNAADLAILAATGSILVSNIMIQSWNSLPVGVGMISSPTSSSNEAAEIAAVYPQFASGLITAYGSLTFSAPGQLVLNTGTTIFINPLSVGWDAPDVLAGNRLSVVIIDQTGTLTATQHGSGSVSSRASNILVLNGNSVDLAAELASVTLNEPNAGADTIDIETYGTVGRLSDVQISVFAAATNQAVTAVNATSNAQGWISSSAFLNNGTVITRGSVLTSETLVWNTTGTLANIVGVARAGQSAFVKIVAIHEPLSEYGVENASKILLGTAMDAVAGVYDPAVDNGSFGSNGYANNPGVNNVSFAPLPGWIPGAFDPATIVIALLVESTVETFDPESGQLAESVDILAPNPLTVVDRTGTHPDTFATAFNNGGSQVTEFNTPNNMAWQAGWGNQFSSAVLTYDGAGQLVEEFLQGGPSNPLFTIDYVFNPNTGELWEEFQSTNTPPMVAGTKNYVTNAPYQPGFATGPLYVTEFNTNNNPNWNYIDWGSGILSDTEVWTDNFIMENFAGFAVNFPDQYSGGLNSYTYQFVNGSALDLMYLPGTISVDLNRLGNVTIESQGMISGLSGLSEIDAAGATGTVTITGLVSGGSTLIGGDNHSTITGYGHDTIIAGAGVSNINTGDGGSTVQLSSATGTATVIGNNNAIKAHAGSAVTLTGSGDTLSGSGVTVSASGTSLTVTGNSDTVSLLATSAVTEGGSANILNYLKGGTLNQNSATSSSVVNGNGITVWMNANGGSVAAYGNNDVITGGSNAIINLTGNGGVVQTGPGSIISVSGNNNIVGGSNVTVAVATSMTTVTISGNNNTITAVAGSSVTLNGSGDILDITGALAANVTIISGQANVGMISVSDTAAHVVANLDALETLAAAGRLTSITFIDTASPTLILSPAQMGAAGGVLGRISSPYILDPTAAEAAVGAAFPNVISVVVSDTTANVAANLGALQALATAGRLGNVNFIDNAMFTVSVAAGQLTAAALAIVQKIASAALLRPVIQLNPKLNLTLTVQDGAAVTVVGAADSDVINLGSGNDMVYLGSAGETVHGGSGNDGFSVTAATIGATITGGSGSNALHAYNGGTMVMGANITGMQTVYLDNGSSGYNFTANQTAGLLIVAGTGNDVVTVGAASQTVYGGMNSLTVLATAANVGAAIYGSSGGTTLEVTTGGTIVLNAADCNLTVKLDAPATIVLSANNSVAIEGSATGNDTFVATTNILNSGQRITGGGGNNALVLQGAGTFVLTAPAQLTDIETVIVTGAAAGEAQTVYLRPGLNLTLTVQDGAAVTVVGAADSDVINLGSGNDMVYLGSAGETVHGGSGNDGFSVTAATIGATITGGSGSNALHAYNGGTMVMGANITGMQTVYLDNGSSGYNFTANQTAGLLIVAGTGNDVVTVGAASQTVYGGMNSLTVLATAANVGAAIYGSSGGTTLEVTTGGTIVLNAADCNLTVKLDAPATIVLSANNSVAIEGSATGNDTFVATTNILNSGQRITGGGGNNALVLQGAGTFVLTAPAQLTDIETVIVTGAAAGEAQTVYLRPGLNLTLTVQDGAAVTVVGAADSDVINLGSGNDMVYLGSAGETVHGGSGNDGFSVTAATIGATITGGSGSNALHAYNGGTMVMGANITGMQTVYLDNGSSGYNFTANQTAGLLIVAGTGNDVVTVGAASQTVYGGTNSLTVLATAANAGAAIYGSSGGTTLEVTTGGTIVLNAADCNLTLKLDISANLYLGGMSFITGVGASAGHDTIVAGGANQTLRSVGGNDTLIGSSSFGDIFSGTATGISGDTIRFFGGNDIIDITDLAYSSVKTLSFNPTSGTLQIAASSQVVTFGVSGVYSSANFAAQSDSRGGTLISFVGH